MTISSSSGECKYYKGDFKLQSLSQWKVASLFIKSKCLRTWYLSEIVIVYHTLSVSLSTCIIFLMLIEWFGCIA